MTSLIFTDQQYRILHAHLFPGDGLEAVAFALATEVKQGGRKRLLVNEVHLVPYEVCERNAEYITWNTRDIAHVLDKADRAKKVVIKIHSHPYGPRAFSPQDDRSDAGLFPAIFNWVNGLHHHASVVFTEDFIVGRTLDSKNQVRKIDNIWVAGHPLRLFPHRAHKPVIGFDESTYNVFRGLRVGVVGTSGTGGWVCELLGRNEVGGLVACDADVLKEKNLNRVVNSKLHLCEMNKAVLAANAVREMGLGTIVEICESVLHTKDALNLFKTCDVIIGCTDSVFARYLLNLFCSYYMIPMFDVGVHIAATPNQITHAVAGFEYFVPNGSSFLTRGIFSSKDLAAETYALSSPEHFERLKKDGYIRGLNVARPAVSAINCLGATLCFEEFQARVLNYRHDHDPVASKVFCAKSGETFVKQEKTFAVDTILEKKAGLGDDFFINESHLLFGEESAKASQSAASIATPESSRSRWI